MSIQVKELKDDAIIAIKVNKAYYLMVKDLSLYLFKHIEVKDKTEYIKEIMAKEYKNLDPLQRALFTTILLLMEIEKESKINDLYIDKTILEPGDAGYIAPIID